MIIFGLRKKKSIEERRLALISQINRINSELANMKWLDHSLYGHVCACAVEDRVSSQYSLFPYHFN